jgi:hypothetical protein
VRRALRLLAAATALAAAASALLGLAAARRMAAALELPAGPAFVRGALDVAHGATGHVAAVLACLVAGMTFLIGLHALLETGGRRLRGAVLFTLAPVLMGLALWTGITGLRGRGDGGPTLARDDLRAFVAGHGALGGIFAGTALLALAASFALARPDRPDSGEDDEAD